MKDQNKPIELLNGAWLSEVFHDSQGSYRACRRLLSDDEVKAMLSEAVAKEILDTIHNPDTKWEDNLLSQAALDETREKSVFVLSFDGSTWAPYFCWRHDIEKPAVTLEGAVPMPSEADIGAVSETLAKKALEGFDISAQLNQTLPKEITDPLAMDRDTRGLAGAGLDVSDVSKPLEPIRCPGTGVPTPVGGHASVITKAHAERCLETAGAAVASLGKILEDNPQRAWVTLSDIVWAERLVENYLKATTDIAERRLTWLSKSLAQQLVYGLFKRKRLGNVNIERSKLDEISSAWGDMPAEQAIAEEQEKGNEDES